VSNLATTVTFLLQLSMGLVCFHLVYKIEPMTRKLQTYFEEYSCSDLTASATSSVETAGEAWLILQQKLYYGR